LIGATTSNANPPEPVTVVPSAMSPHVSLLSVIATDESG